MLSQQLENLLPKEETGIPLEGDELASGVKYGWNDCLSQCKQSIPEMLKKIREEIENIRPIYHWTGGDAEYLDIKDILDLLK